MLWRTSALAIAAFWLTPVMTLAESRPSQPANWQDWVKQNPTYPTQAPPSPTPTPGNQSPPRTWSTPTTTTRYRYPDSIVQEFMQGCLASSGGKQAYCECAIQQLQNTYTLEEMANVVLKMQNTGLIPEGFQQAIVSCLQYVER